ncbi:MAG: 23S rRNA (uracil(1939)-C(5))-methyltransferase RlmD, partial [Eubacterium sp.]|nr:23S rRNA (uracil(1939)-C(5))-methyltransferase RlmD [Eubacterium sp.]
WMEKYRITAYDEKSGTGIVRHIFMRKSRLTGEIQVCLIINAGKLPKAAELQACLTKSEPGEEAVRISGLLYSVNRERTNVIFLHKPRFVYGQAALEDSLSSEKYGFEIRYRISPLSFYQINPYVAECMYEKVLELAQLSETETVFDLYCGIGTLSLFLARKAGKVIGVEVVPDAVENAKENAARNQIGNAVFYEGKAEEVVPALLREDPDLHADIVTVDPPRKGCEASLLETIAEISPKKIIYVSCDPATLARDLKILSEKGYRTEYVQPYDQFVFTTHVETVCLMSRI